MRRRPKQILYGLGYVLFLVGIIALVYIGVFKPAPSCFDGIKNQGEEDVDCGEVCGNSCAILSVRSVEIATVETVGIKGKTIAVVEIRNPNSLFGASGVSYSLVVADRFGQAVEISDSTFVYPGEIRFRVLINVPNSSLPNLDSLPYKLSTEKVEWIDASGFLRPDSQIRNIQSRYDRESGLLIVGGILKNANDYAISSATISGIVRDRTGELVGASHTLVKDLKPQEERFFQIVTPIVDGLDEVLLAPVKISVEMVR